MLVTLSISNYQMKATVHGSLSLIASHLLYIINEHSKHNIINTFLILYIILFSYILVQHLMIYNNINEDN